MASKFKQEMPPGSGYGPIEWARRMPKKGWSGYAMFGGFFAVTGVAWGIFYYSEQILKRQRVEMMDSRIALEPLILAEKHRMILKQFRRNRDEENELMKDHPGWQTGKLYDEPVFHNPRGRFMWPGWYEFYAHNSWWDMYNRIYEKGNH